MENWQWAQWAILGLWVLVVACAIILDGKERKGKHQFIETAFGLLVYWVLLYFGGFFS